MKKKNEKEQTRLPLWCTIPFCILVITCVIYGINNTNNNDTSIVATEDIVYKELSIITNVTPTYNKIFCYDEEFIKYNVTLDIFYNYNDYQSMYDYIKYPQFFIEIYSDKAIQNVDECRIYYVTIFEIKTTNNLTYNIECNIYEDCESIYHCESVLYRKLDDCISKI